jgi:hypothetical protein
MLSACSRWSPRKINNDLLVNRQRLILRLLQQFRQTLAALRAAPESTLVEVAEANCANAASSRKRARSSFMRTGHLLTHRLDLRGRTYARNRSDPTLMAGRTTGVEQVRLEEDLAVRDRDHVGRDIGRNVVEPGFR